MFVVPMFTYSVNCHSHITQSELIFHERFYWLRFFSPNRYNSWICQFTRLSNHENWSEKKKRQRQAINCHMYELKPHLDGLMQ